MAWVFSNSAQLSNSQCLDDLPSITNASTLMADFSAVTNNYIQDSIHLLIIFHFQHYSPVCLHFPVNNICQFAFQQAQWSDVNSCDADSFSSPDDAWVLMLHCILVYWGCWLWNCSLCCVMDFSLCDCQMFQKIGAFAFLILKDWHQNLIVQCEAISSAFRDIHTNKQ